MRVHLPVLLMLSGLPVMALAGRPGTPDDVVAWVDGTTVYNKRPQVCVRFHNSAKSPVGFFVEWSRNGEQFTGKELLGDKVTCGDLRGFAFANSCASGTFAKVQGATVRPSDAAHFMCLREYEPESEYCFRFRSFDEDGLWSEFWSPTSCARTPPVPGLPAAPSAPQLTILPSEGGRGSAGAGQPLRVLLEWGARGNSVGPVGQYFVQQKIAGGSFADIPEQVTGPFYPDASKTEFEAVIPFPNDPPTDTRRHEFRICAMNWGGRSCSASRKTPMGLKQEAALSPWLTDSALQPGSKSLDAKVSRESVSRITSVSPPAGAAAVPANLNALAEAGAALAADDELARKLRESLAEGEARRGFDIGMAVARDHTEWGPGKQRIHDSLTVAGQSGFKTATSYLFDRNRYAQRARLGASIAAADATLQGERSADDDVRFQLGFDIATAIFGDPATGAQGNRAAGPGSMGIRDSLSPPAQRGFDAAMKLHLSRTY